MQHRELTLLICPGRVPPGSIEAQALVNFPDQPPRHELLWVLLPEGRVPRGAIARLLLRILRQQATRGDEAAAAERNLNEPRGVPLWSHALAIGQLREESDASSA